MYVCFRKSNNDKNIYHNDQFNYYNYLAYHFHKYPVTRVIPKGYPHNG